MMSRSCFAPLPIPRAARLANPNRRPPERRLVFICSVNSSNKTAVFDSVTYTATSAAKLYSSVAPIPSTSLFQPRPSPELGLSAVLFVLSAVFGSFLSFGLISVAAMGSFRRLAISASRLEKEVAREVPGTLLSLRLSCIEISAVTQRLSSVRRVVPGADSRVDEKDRKDGKRRL